MTNDEHKALQLAARTVKPSRVAEARFILNNQVTLLSNQRRDEDLDITDAYIYRKAIEAAKMNGYNIREVWFAIQPV